MKKYDTPELNMLAMQSKDIVAFSINMLWDDLESGIKYDKEKVEKY